MKGFASAGDTGASMGKSWNSTQNHDANSIERVQNFEEAFNKIKQATGISDVEELVRTFIKNEDHNFSLFNYVNEQNNEVEKYEEQIQALREEERKFAQESGDDGKLASSESMSEKYEVRCQDLQRVVESLKRGLQSTYDKLDIPAAEDEEINSSAAVLGDAAVSETNMVHFLGVIEQKANRLLQVYAEVRQAQLVVKKEEEASKTNASVLGTGPKVRRGQELLNVNPPKVDEYQSDDEDDDDEDDTRPLTRDELKTRT
eukprot:GSChrysophyteH2.ASY1.ANO1.158.1 assembled CDS